MNAPLHQVAHRSTAEQRGVVLLLRNGLAVECDFTDLHTRTLILQKRGLIRLPAARRIHVQWRSFEIQIGHVGLTNAGNHASKLKGGFSMKTAALASIVVCLLVGAFLVSTTVAVPPQDLDKAERTTTTLANALVAAVVSISNATPLGSSPADIEANSEAVSLLVPECQTSYKLIDASGDPLDLQNFPQGSFEINAMMALVNGAPIVQEVMGADLRTVVPLTSDMHPNCATCHANYSGLAPGTVVGAASFKVKL